MVRPLVLGHQTFPVNLIQGPLAGVSCAPFRLLTTRYGGPAYTCTEMISAKTLIHQPKSYQKRYVEIHPEEGPVCFQLAGTDPHEIAEATKIATACGADLIDLNCGCPVKKIRSKGAGSGLLTNPSLLYQLICSMKNSTHLPVSIKIRVQARAGEAFNQTIASVVADAGVDVLVVHGRHWTEHYETPCRYEEIRFFVEALNIPVIGNGDVACLASLQKMLATGCAGAMIGRAGVGRPWLVRELVAGMTQVAFTLPSVAMVAEMFIEHIERLASLLNNEKFAILQARNMAKYYSRRAVNSQAFCAAMNTCETMAQFISLCRTLS